MVLNKKSSFFVEFVSLTSPPTDTWLAVMEAKMFCFELLEDTEQIHKDRSNYKYFRGSIVYNVALMNTGI